MGIFKKIKEYYRRKKAKDDRAEKIRRLLVTKLNADKGFKSRFVIFK